jgi:hypothetical protein
MKKCAPHPSSCFMTISKKKKKEWRERDKDEKLCFAFLFFFGMLGNHAFAKCP